MSQTIAEQLEHVILRRRAGARVAACLLVRTKGSVPRAAGAIMFVDDAGNSWGTIGGGCAEAEVEKQLPGMLRDGRTGLLEFALDHDHGWDDGMICGGTLEVAVAPPPDDARLREIVADLADRRATALELEIDADAGRVRYTLDLPPRERLYIAGCGHLGSAVARHGVALEYDVTLFDDRAELLERFAPPGARTIDGDIAAALRAAPVDGETSCVIVTRGHLHDTEALGAVVDRGAKYVGMIGSRRKIGVVYEELTARGVTSATLDAVDAPIGLPIGAVTVEEIAISIVARLVEERRRTQGRPVSGPHAVPAAAPGASG